MPVLRNEVPDGRPILAQLFAAVQGKGELAANGNQPAEGGLASADLTALTIEPREEKALLSGGQVATALALAGLFEAEGVLRSALVAGALSAEAVRSPSAFLHPRAHRFRRHKGRIDVRRRIAAAPGESADPCGAGSRQRTGCRTARAEPGRRR